MKRICEIAWAWICCNLYVLRPLLSFQHPMCFCYVTRDKRRRITGLGAGLLVMNRIVPHRIFYSSVKAADVRRGICRSFTIQPGDWKSAGASGHFYVWTAPKEWLAEGFNALDSAFDPIPREFMGRNQVRFEAPAPNESTVEVAW